MRGETWTTVLFTMNERVPPHTKCNEWAVEVYDTESEGRVLNDKTNLANISTCKR